MLKKNVCMYKFWVDSNLISIKVINNIFIYNHPVILLETKWTICVIQFLFENMS